MSDLPGGTVTFLFTDIEGSTTRWERQSEAMRVALARAHGQYYLDLAKAVGPLLFADPATVRRSLAEFHNIHEAMRWLFRHG